MAPRTIQKTSGILVALISIALCLHPSPEIYGIYVGSPASNRLLFSLFHASAIHTILNLWCFLSLVFLYPVSTLQLAIAFFISVTAPDCVLFSTPTVGLSAVCYSLIGLLAPVGQGALRLLRYLAFFTPYLVLGFIFPSVNGLLHIYCMVASIIIVTIQKLLILNS